MPTEFKLFESGAGGDFATFIGKASGSFYRLNLSKVYYQNISEASFLADAEKSEGALLRVPNEIKCKICQTIYSPESVAIDGEEIIEAYEL